MLKYTQGYFHISTYAPDFFELNLAIQLIISDLGLVLALYNPSMSNPFSTRDTLAPGMRVVIVEKHQQRTDEESIGTIERILTHDFSHPHGIKVMLSDGRVGRVKRIV